VRLLGDGLADMTDNVNLTDLTDDIQASRNPLLKLLYFDVKPVQPESHRRDGKAMGYRWGEGRVKRYRVEGYTKRQVLRGRCRPRSNQFFSWGSGTTMPGVRFIFGISRSSCRPLELVDQSKSQGRWTMGCPWLWKDRTPWLMERTLLRAMLILRRGGRGVGSVGGV
jgi:hypothetical protein